MKYRVEKLNESICSIKLVPENADEEQVLLQPENEKVFAGHYRQALTKFVDKNASLVEIVNRAHYPSHVLVTYTIEDD